MKPNQRYHRFLNPPRNSILAAAFVSLFMVSTLSIAEPASSTHAKSANQSDWHEILEITIERAPEKALLKSYIAGADLARAQARAWVAAAPTVGVRYQTDALDDDLGYQETELALELPLWRISQRQAAAKASEAQGAQAALFPDALRLMVAGQLRDAYWSYRAALAEELAAKQALARSESMVQKITRLVELGEKAPVDLLSAETERSRLQQAYASAAQSTEQQASLFSSLTGLASIPDLGREAIVTSSEANENPLLQLARFAAEKENQNAHRVKKSAAGQPSITLSTRQERVSDGAERSGYVGLGYNLPVGAERFSGSDYASALHNAANAQIEARKLARELRRQINLLGTQIPQLEHQLVSAAERLQQAEKLSQLASRAFESGEMGILDLIRSQQANAAAQLTLDQTKVALGRAIANYNQAVGVTP
ncbi:MAG: TolC family protein [Thiotrichales bacterium]